MAAPSSKARTTKSVARIKRAADLSQDLTDLTDRRKAERGIGSVVRGGRRRANDLIVLDELKVERGGKELITNLSMTLHPGMRLGLVGNNGSGKSSLIMVLSEQQKLVGALSALVTCALPILNSTVQN